MFGFRRKKTVESMLADARSVGIGLRPGIKLESVWAEWSKEQIEKDGFELLLVALGGEQFEPKTFMPLEPLSDDVWHFDSECIEDHGSYTRIVENCSRISGGDLKFSKVTDYVDVENKTAWIEVSTEAGQERIELSVNDDWVDPRVFDVLQAKLTASGSKRRFAAHNLGQDCLLVCRTVPQIDKINDVTGMHFGDLNM